MAEALTAKNLDELGISHGFFERNGGVSKAPFDTLNASVAVGDDADTVNQNLDLVAKSVGVEPSSLCLVKQTHSIDVLAMTAAPDRATRPEADGIVTATPGLALGILTADCGPVLFADPKNRVIGACHAGWKGAVGGIVDNTIYNMIKLGAERKYIVAALGPCIHLENYEVGDTFESDVTKQFPQTLPHFKMPNGADAPHFDLPECIMQQLESANIADAFQMPNCTYDAPSQFFSHRYATHKKIKTGRQISVIALL